MSIIDPLIRPTGGKGHYLHNFGAVVQALWLWPHESSPILYEGIPSLHCRGPPYSNQTRYPYPYSVQIHHTPASESNTNPEGSETTHPQGGTEYLRYSTWSVTSIMISHAFIPASVCLTLTASPLDMDPCTHSESGVYRREAFITHDHDRIHFS